MRAGLRITAWGVWAVAVAIAGPAHAAPDLRAALEGFVRERAPQPPSAIEIPPLGDFALDTEGAELQLSVHPEARFLGRVPVRVAWVAGGRTLKQGVVTVRVRVEGPVWVAARRLRRGERLAAADLRLEPRDLSELPADVLREGSALDGLRTRRGLAAGAALTPTALEPAPLVLRGEAVRIELERGGLRIEARGEARDDGRHGEAVRVMNRDSRRELSGRVVGEGVVRVAF